MLNRKLSWVVVEVKDYSEVVTSSSSNQEQNSGLLAGIFDQAFILVPSMSIERDYRIDENGDDESR